MDKCPCKTEANDAKKPVMRCGGCPCNGFSCDKVINTGCKCRRKMFRRYDKIIRSFGHLRVGERAPPFECEALMPGGAPGVVKLSDFQGLVRSKWLVLAFYCGDFSNVCPTEVVALNKALDKFHDANAEIVGISVDSVNAHLAWTSIPPEQGGVGPIGFPLVADTKRFVAMSYGAFRRPTGVCERVTVIVDDKGLVREIIHHPDGVGRCTNAILRHLRGLQAVDAEGTVCPANWMPGEPTLKKDSNIVLAYRKKALA